jgi:UDP-N-acetylmuramate dehydrogenase
MVKIDANKKLISLINFLKNNNVFFKENHLIKYETYFKKGGNVKVYIEPQNYETFKKAITFLHSEQIGYKIIGFTSNLIFFDEIEYSVIISTKNFASLFVKNSTIEVEAGYSLESLVRVAIINGSKGYEGLEGIPASIGGAIFMNAGAYGHTISDNLISVEAIDSKNNLVTLKRAECQFDYRHSIFKNGKYIILKAIFKLHNGDRAKISRNVERFHIARHSYQDFVYPNLGSMISIQEDPLKYIFKNNKLYYVVYWILKFFLKNPVSKFLMRKRPNNEILNSLLVKYIRDELKFNIKYNLSNKSANILINDETISIKDILGYLFLINELVGDDFHIENEIVLNPIYKLKPEFKSFYSYVLKKVEKS